MDGRKLILTLALLCVTGCAPRLYSAALGRYDEFRPYAALRGRGGSIQLELARPAYVAIIGINTPAPAYQERPVLFRPVYPVWDTDESHFNAGRHRVSPRQQTLRRPLDCRGNEKPTISGCRRPAYLYAGLVTQAEVAEMYGFDPDHYLVIASEEFIDPYVIADDLFELTFEREELSGVLKRRLGRDAASDLERALLDRPGSPFWGALYVAGR